MEEIIAPISKEILKAELSEDKRLRFTNKSHNEIYVITYQDSPNVMKEIGRLREIAFRAAGGGTGKAMDIDEYDVMENPYKQLVVWNPEAEEILGGYRYLLGDEVQFDEHGKPVLATAHMFNFSEVFLKEYLPYTVELGRSFVTLEYVKADMQGTACPYQREGGVYLDQQIGSQSTDQQIDYILPFIARDDPEKQAYKDGNREGESSLCHIYLEFVIACHGLIVR